MTDVKSTSGKFKAFALVRDKDGKPKIDDPATLPAELFKALTAKEVKEIYRGELPPHLKNLEA
jgi:hypothetical protein